jgi:cellulose synthase/poly-beta-1,6-N-acetylglucosamine synthase-like glycosyltransferase
VLGILFQRKPHAAPHEPTVSLLVAAYNEAGVITAKLKNALALDYPAEKLEIVVASDGSTDGTAELASHLADGKRVRVLPFPDNRGKLYVLNDSVRKLRGDIIVFSDAASMLEPDAVRRLMENFADPRVGGVSGIYSVRKTEQAQLGASEDLYWKYETFLKRQESRLGSILGCHGALYAIRKSLYPFPAPSTINDDYVIPIRVLQQGYRVVYDPRAVAWEEAHEMKGFSRRVRIMTGNFEQLRELGALLRPFQPLNLWFFLSHKVGRLVVPFCLVGMIVTNLLLLDRPFYRVLAILQAVFYLLTLLGALWQLRPKILRLPYYFSMINAAAFLGIYYVTLGRSRMTWKRREPAAG